MEPSTYSSRLLDSLCHLVRETHGGRTSEIRQQLLQPRWNDTWRKLELFHELLCERPPTPQLPSHVLRDVEHILAFQKRHQLLTPTSAIPHCLEIPRPSKSKRPPIRISLWRGDITSLTDIVAIVNAANSQLLGCFKPQHKCIDNVIHAAAGPRLRLACNDIMEKQRKPEVEGRAKITPGFGLPARHVLHTVGPQLQPRERPNRRDCEDLAYCYRACLKATATLKPLPDGRLNVAFCCISTGIFAFPPSLAAQVAIEAVVKWCRKYPDTPITDILFDVFTQEDYDIYMKHFQNMVKAPVQFPSADATNRSLMFSPNIEVAKSWLQNADYLIISAGAGLSAAAGLDYTSTSLFETNFPTFLRYNLQRLYDVIGFRHWPSPLVKWSYLYHHMKLIGEWPASPLYNTLLQLFSLFEDKVFVRTSNADGLFAANGFPEDQISTPQGQYKYLQCYEKCRPDACFLSKDFLEVASPYVDKDNQRLIAAGMVPHCKYCGSELTICVRGGSYFLEEPFKKQEEAWSAFLERIEKDTEAKNAVILELGVGLNTPGVLRIPNERLVHRGNGKFKLIRAGIGASGCAPWEFEENGLAVGIDGNISDVVNLLCS